MPKMLKRDSSNKRGTVVHINMLERIEKNPPGGVGRVVGIAYEGFCALKRSV